MQNNHRSWDIAFAIFLFCIPVFSIPYHHGLGVFDSGAYLKAGYYLLRGEWNVGENFYANRIASCVPYAIGMKIFGLSEWLTFITTFELMLIVLVVYVVMSAYSKPAAFISAVVLGASPIMLRYSSDINSDTMATLMVNGLVLLWFYLRQKKDFTTAASTRYGVLAGILFCVAALSKESIAFYLPLLLYFAWTDLKKPVMRRYWVAMGATVLLFVIPVAAFYVIKTGDILYRLRAIEAGPSVSEVNYSGSALLEIVKRITYQPFQFFAEDFTFGILFIFSVLHLAMPNRLPEQSALKKYFVFTTIFWWCGTQSFVSFNPVGLVYRLWMPLLVPMAINAAYALRYLFKAEQFNRNEKIRYSAMLATLLIAFVIVSYLSYTSYQSTGRSVYELNQLLNNIFWISLILLIALIAVWRRGLPEVVPSLNKMVFPVIVFCLGFKVLWSLSWHITDKQSRLINEYVFEKEMVKKLEATHAPVILADYGLSSNYGVYTGFDKALPFKSYNRIALDSIPQGTYLFVNKGRVQYFNDNSTESLTFKKEDYEIPAYVNAPEQNGFTLVEENACCRLYKK